jgi:hypothetical protein
MGNICLFVSTEELDPVSALIREKTECAFSHVGFFHLVTQMTFSAMCDGLGVAWRPVKPSQKMMLLDVENPPPVPLLPIAGDRIPPIDIAKAALDVALTQAGKPYDRLDIAGIALGRDWTTPQHYICSTLVLWSFEQAGWPLLAPWAIPIDHRTPRDILLSTKISQRKAA